MEDPVLTTSEKEKLAIIIQYARKEISGNEAARRLELSLRQVQRKKKAYLEEGATSIIHKSKGKPSGRGFDEELKEEILHLYKTEYYGWNFTHFKEEIEDAYDIYVSVSFLHEYLPSQGIESPARKRKSKPRSHPVRPRRENAGELVQVDASKHQWLYSTKRYFYLHGAIDDATETVTGCIMLEQETALGYQLIMRDTIMRYGIPECLYTDYRTVFQSNTREPSLEDYVSGKKAKDTRFAAMWHKLGSDIISTTDPRAKGRIERLWRTFQDRLVKEFHKHKIGTLEEANRYINETFLPKYNARHAKPIDPKHNNFVPVPADFDYNRQLALWVSRKVINGSFVSIKGQYFIIRDNGKAANIRTTEQLLIYQYLDGSLHLEYEDKLYSLDKIRQLPSLKKTSGNSPAKRRPTTKELSDIKRKASQNSPWRKWNPGYF